MKTNHLGQTRAIMMPAINYLVIHHARAYQQLNFDCCSDDAHLFVLLNHLVGGGETDRGKATQRERDEDGS